MTNINQVVDTPAPRKGHDYFGTGRAMAVQQGDFARDEEITVISVCTGNNCKSNATDTEKIYIRETMKRIANDPSFNPALVQAGQWFWCETAATTTTPNNTVLGGVPHCTYGFYNKRTEDPGVPAGEFHALEDLSSGFLEILEEIAAKGKQAEVGLIK